LQKTGREPTEEEVEFAKANTPKELWAKLDVELAQVHIVSSFA